MSLDVGLSDVPGTVSVWFGPPGGPARFARAPDEPHYAASLMKLAVLVALHHAVDEGLDPGTQVEVANHFVSAAPGGGTFGCRRSYDSDDQVWDRLGGSATLGWLAERMIIRSSNLATNLVLAHLGLPAVADVWRRAGAGVSVVTRGIEDTRAAEAGLANLVSVADLALLLSAITAGASATDPALASPAACRRMLDTLLAQEHRDDLAAGLPPHVPVAHKSGWIMGVRHGAGVVFPPDADPFVLAVCATTPWAINQHDDNACQLVARIASAAWSARRPRLDLGTDAPG